MTIEQDFQTFIEALPTADQETLGASVFVAAGALCAADQAITFRELIALVKGVVAGTDALGPGFGPLLTRGKIGLEQHKLTVERELATLKEKLRQDPSLEELSALQAKVDSSLSQIALADPILTGARSIAERMTPEVRAAFDDFVAALLLRIAEASGGFLWWGEKINAQERAAAQQLLGALGVTVRDPATRAKFALDAPAA